MIKDVQVRPGISDRFYKVMTYQPVDRVPDFEFGYWPQTIRRWLKEGLPADYEARGGVDRCLGFDELRHVWFFARAQMNPGFEERVIERKERSVVKQLANGVTAECYEADSDDASIPHYLKFPVETPADWERIKERYPLEESCRSLPSDEVASLRAKSVDHVVRFHACGVYAQLREWMGFENVSVAFYEYPEMIHEMVELHAEIVARTLDNLPADIPVDHVNLWEDMASKNGPFCSPDMMREFLQPGYRRIMAAARRHGCGLGVVDCDGNPSVIVGNWLEEGLNMMFPIEQTDGVDAYEWRRRHGLALRLEGGVAKVPLAQGGAAIDRELERIKPLIDQGGYIPHLDHLVPPDIPYKNYMEYLDKKRKLIGK